MKKYLFIFLAAVFIISGTGLTTRAQEETTIFNSPPPATTENTADAEGATLPSGAATEETDNALPVTNMTEAVAQDENITSADLAISEPKILPGNPLYFTKGISRSFQSALTRDPIKKAELKIRFANEKIIEAKLVAERTDDPKKLEKAIENYKKETEKVEKTIEKIAERLADKPQLREEAGQIAEKLMDNNIKHAKLLGKFERDFSPEVFEDIQETKNKVSEAIALAPLTLLSPEEYREKLEEVMERHNEDGSDFAPFKHLEILQEVGDRVPEQARAVIARVQERQRERLEERFLQADGRAQEQFREYISGIGGNETRHLAVLDDLEKTDFALRIKPALDQARDKVASRVELKMKTLGDEVRQDLFLAHLKEGKMEDVRIVKELESKLDPETINKILAIKQESMARLAEEFQQSKTPEERDEFFAGAEKFHDARQMAIFQEIEKVLPEDKKELLGEMKKKAFEEMQDGIEKSKRLGSEEMRKRMMETLVGDDPENLKIFEDMKAEFRENLPEGINASEVDGVFGEMAREHARFVGKRIGDIENFEQFDRFRSKIEGDDEIKELFEKQQPDIFQNFQQRNDDLLEKTVVKEVGMNPERIKPIMEKADNLIREAEVMLQNASDGERIGRMIVEAREKLNRAKEAMDRERYGEAFGQSTAALNIAGNAMRHLKDMSLRQETERFFKESGAVDEQGMPMMKEGIMPFNRQQMIQGDQREESRERFEEFFKKRIEEKEIKDVRQIQPTPRPLPPIIKTESTETNRVDSETPNKETSNSVLPPPPTKETACITLFDPVCGSDGVTYSNKCFAEKAGVGVISRGSCPVKTEPKIEIKPIENQETIIKFESNTSTEPVETKTISR